MSDRRTMARAARQRLAHALATLQHPGIPADLHFVAEPIAEAMTLLHEVETAGPDAPAGLPHTALMAVRRALSGIQAQAPRHPAIAMCVESVAGALNLAHVLSTLPPPTPSIPRPSEPPPSVAPIFTDYRLPSDVAHTPPPAPDGPREPANDRAQSFSRPSLEASRLMDPLLGASPPRPASTTVQQAPEPSASPPPVGRPAFTAEPLSPPPAQAPLEATSGSAGPDRDDREILSRRHSPLERKRRADATARRKAAAADQAGPGSASPKDRFVNWGPEPVSSRRRAGLAETEHASDGDGAYRPPGAPAPASESELATYQVELTTHSASNFYKGLAGNNVIDSGGVFVATYRVPDVGTHVLIDFLLPGGYEFRAKGIVSWTRETSSEGDFPPGFGARFTEVPVEGVTLITRYVRNRDPLLHDDP